MDKRQSGKTSRSRSRRPAQRRDTPRDSEALDDGQGGPYDGEETTGRYMVLLRQDAVGAGAAALADTSGFRVTNAADIGEEATPEEALEEGGAVAFDNVGVIVVDAAEDRFQALNVMAADSPEVLAVEPVGYVYALGEWSDDPAGGIAMLPAADQYGPRPVTAMDGVPADYLRGYRDAVNNLVEVVLETEETAGGPGSLAAVAWDETELTWGLQATKAPASRFTGNGIKVAVLDTGLDLQHPDFTGRRITSRSFINGEAVQDGRGHGTHCTGTACGPLRPGQLPRYGIAYEAEIFIGKVLNNAGRGTDIEILAGIDWAIANGCEIVSMSLGAGRCGGAVRPPSQVFENVGRRALAQGTLIVAAAGNDSNRPQGICPVSHPANCASIFAVGAIDSRFRVASFSNAGLSPQGGQVDIAGPGVNVRSSYLQPQLYRSLNGTSMATPHVAGIAALFAEANPGVRGRGLMSLLLQQARRLPLPARDVGAGLVQAP